MRRIILSLASVSIAACSAQNSSGSPSADQVDSAEIGGQARIIAPNETAKLWVSPEEKDNLGSGGELEIYVDSETAPNAKSSFAKFSLGKGGALPEHRHDRTEEVAYFLDGEGIATVVENGEKREYRVAEGYVWYNPPGVWHSLRNVGSGRLTLVFATTPNIDHGLLSFFRSIGVEPGKEPKRMDQRDFEKLAGDHDMILRKESVE